MKNVKKISKHQLDHLRALIPGERGSYPGLNLGILNPLAMKCLVSAKYGLGSIARPHTTIMWRLTPKGSKYITEMTYPMPGAGHDHQQAQQQK